MLFLFPPRKKKKKKKILFVLFAFLIAGRLNATPPIKTKEGAGKGGGGGGGGGGGSGSHSHKDVLRSPKRWGEREMEVQHKLKKKKKKKKQATKSTTVWAYLFLSEKKPIWEMTCRVSGRGRTLTKSIPKQCVHVCVCVLVQYSARADSIGCWLCHGSSSSSSSSSSKISLEMAPPRSLPPPTLLVGWLFLGPLPGRDCLLSSTAFPPLPSPPLQSHSSSEKSCLCIRRQMCR